MIDEDILSDFCCILNGYFGDVDDEKALNTMREDMAFGPEIVRRVRAGLEMLLDHPEYPALPFVTQCANRQVGGTESGARDWLERLNRDLFPARPMPASADREYQWGMSCLRTDDCSDEEAEGYFDRALVFDPNCIGALIMKAAFLRQRGRFADALTMCDRILALEPAALESLSRPQLASVWRNKGLALHGLGRLEEEIAFYEQMLATNLPVAEQAELWGLKGAALMFAGKLKEAQSCMMIAVSLGNKRVGDMLHALSNNMDN